MKQLQLAAALALCLLGVRGWADTYTWTGASTTDATAWSETDNWSIEDGTVTAAPGSSDSVVFSSNASVVLSETTTVSSIQISEGVTLTLSGGRLCVTLAMALRRSYSTAVSVTRQPYDEGGVAS